MPFSFLRVILAQGTMLIFILYKRTKDNAADLYESTLYKSVVKRLVDFNQPREANLQPSQIGVSGVKRLVELNHQLKPTFAVKV
jgi:hypothetical protein